MRYGLRKRRSWSGVEGMTVVDADKLGEAARVALAPFRSDDLDDRRCDEVGLTFSSSGYYDPGRYDGPWENCYPEEYDDERLLIGAVIDVSVRGECKGIPMSKDVLRILDDDPVVIKAIKEAELDHREEYDGPDRYDEV